jgi:putative long chain acyl-CoA synthase
VTFAQANTRVDNVVRGLIQCDIRPAMHVGILMRPRPSSLSATMALNRLGAVAVLIKPTEDVDALRRAVGLGQLSALVTDPEHAALARETFDGKVLVLGGGAHRRVIEGVVDMEAIDPAQVELPRWYVPNPGRAEDVFCIIVTVGPGGHRAARITNRRWAFSAYGAAAACTLSPNDTVYCCLPLHHPAGLLVAAGSALAGGTRLAMASRFSPDVFWDEVRLYGATVAYYAGEMCRELVDAPRRRGERMHPLRLLAGSGMRADVWRRLGDRFGVGVLEFYAATEVSVVLANASGKIGALGRPLPGSREAFLAAFHLARGDFIRDRRGRIVAAQPGQPGMLLARIDPSPLAPLDERAPPVSTPGASLPRIVRGVHEDRDPWFVTGDLMERDADGDYWMIESLGNLIHTGTGPVVTRALEDALYALPQVRLAAAYGVTVSSGAEVPVATIVLQPGALLGGDAIAPALLARGEQTALPVRIAVRETMPMTDGYRPLKEQLRAGGMPEAPCFVLEGEQYRFVPAAG